MDHTLAQLAETQFFIKLDTSSGFWKVTLFKESVCLTTFITPYGRFCFDCLPFGTPSPPEPFQHHMSITLKGLEGVTCLMDAILIHGKSREEYDNQLRKVTEAWYYSEQTEVLICHKLRTVPRSHYWKRKSKVKPRESARHQRHIRTKKPDRFMKISRYV